MKNFDNDEYKASARKLWWAYRSGNKSQSDFPDVRISAITPAALREDLNTREKLDLAAKQRRNPNLQTLERDYLKNRKQFIDADNQREKAIQEIKKAIQGKSPIAMPYARMLLGDDIVQGLIQANARNYDALQQALRNELEQWMKPI